LRVAIVHDWLTGMRGGERVLEGLLELFPEAELFTLLHVQGSVSAAIEARPIHTSFVQQLPRAATRYRWYLPLFPWAIEQLDLSGFELVISSSHCAAKAALTDPGAVHLCYCHTPMRYAWDQFDAYFSPERNGRAAFAAIRPTIAWLRRWDRATAGRVDAFAANSAWVAGRIQRYYGRLATVIPPPVDTDFFVPGGDIPADDVPASVVPGDVVPGGGSASAGVPGNPALDAPYLVVSALSPYKRIDVVIEAFNRMGKPLVVAGSGPDAGRLAALAGPTVQMRGWVEAEELRRLYQGCRAVVLAAVEDAGIVPLEALACGRPAIVLARGGTAETITDGVTGIHIRGDDAAAVIEAVDRAEGVTFNSSDLRTAALYYAPERFMSRLRAFIGGALDGAGAATTGASRAGTSRTGRAATGDAGRAVVDGGAGPEPSQ
jgi:glycosyltransferase involved in cell wall biosynthesis